jgi:hypothetical protein
MLHFSCQILPWNRPLPFLLGDTKVPTGLFYNYMEGLDSSSRKDLPQVLTFHTDRQLLALIFALFAGFSKKSGNYYTLLLEKPVFDRFLVHYSSWLQNVVAFLAYGIFWQSYIKPDCFRFTCRTSIFYDFYSKFRLFFFFANLKLYLGWVCLSFVLLKGRHLAQLTLPLQLMLTQLLNLRFPS